jgi:predicted Zn-dependent peptidase
MIKKQVLSNGLRILYKKTNTASVALVISVKAGCIYEPDELMGVSHFLEHMIFNGTKTRSQIQISRTIENLGGEFNAATDTDNTIFYIRILKKHFDVALEILSDIILNSVFPQELFDREKGIVLDEINMVHDNPRQHQFSLFQDALFKGHPASKRILGTKETIANLTRDQLFNFYKKFYVPNNMVVSVAGDVENVFPKIESKFGFLESQELVLPNIPIQENSKREVLEKRKISQSYFMMGYVIPPQKDKNSFTFDVIRAILGRVQSGWIFDEIRNKRGLAYEAGVYLDHSINNGSICVYINSHKKNFETIKKVIFEQFERLQNLTEEELVNMKTYIEGEFILGHEDNVKLAEEMAFQELCTNAKDLEHYIDNINKVTLEDVKSIAKKFLTQNYSQSIIEQTD